MHPFCDLSISSTRNINLEPDLFENKYLQLSCTDLLKEHYIVEEKLSDDEIKVIERETFFRQRAGSIGASKCPSNQSHRSVPALPGSDQNHMPSRYVSV